MVISATLRHSLSSLVQQHMQMMQATSESQHHPVTVYGPDCT
jgi:hypothetical protein